MSSCGASLRTTTSTTLGASSSSHLHPISRFRDLVIFEDRLKQNALVLSRIRKRHKILLWSISFCIMAYFVHLFFMDYFPTSILVSNIFLFVFSSSIASLVGLVLYQYFSLRLSHSAKFSPQIRKDLELFNMTFNDSTIGFSKRIPKKWQDIFFAYRLEALQRRLVKTKVK